MIQDIFAEDQSKEQKKLTWAYVSLRIDVMHMAHIVLAKELLKQACLSMEERVEAKIYQKGLDAEVKRYYKKKQSKKLFEKTQKVIRSYVKRKGDRLVYKNLKAVLRFVSIQQFNDYSESLALLEKLGKLKGKNEHKRLLKIRYFQKTIKRLEKKLGLDK